MEIKDQTFLTYLAPLAGFYQRKGIEFPESKSLAGDQIPQPYHSLLVHDKDMTSSLANFFNDEIELNVIQLHKVKLGLERWVSLHLKGNGQPVELGAISIYKEAFNEEPWSVIENCEKPLGQVLHDYKVPYLSQPNLFFQIEADSYIQTAFGCNLSDVFYGRSNVLSDPHSGNPLARVVEILPQIKL